MGVFFVSYYLFLQYSLFVVELQKWCKSCVNVCSFTPCRRIVLSHLISWALWNHVMGRTLLLFPRLLLKGGFCNTYYIVLWSFLMGGWILGIGDQGPKFWDDGGAVGEWQWRDCIEIHIVLEKIVIKGSIRITNETLAN